MSGGIIEFWIVLSATVEVSGRRAGNLIRLPN